MPATKQTLRYRGRVRILLKRIVKVKDQVLANNARYPQPPLNRNNILSTTLVADLVFLATFAQTQLSEKWPPLEESAPLAAPKPGGLTLEPEDS